MPDNAIELNTSIEIYPRPTIIEEVPLIAGETTTDGPDEPVKVESREEAEDEFGTDTRLTDEIKNAFDEGVPVVYGYEAPLDGTTYPDDVDWSAVEDDFTSAEDASIVSFIDIDPVEGYDALEDAIDAAKSIHSVLVADASVSDPSTASLDVEDKNLFVVAHDYTDDVLGNIAGAVAMVEPYEKLMWKEVSEVDVQNFYKSADIDTLESENINALMPWDDRMIFSNGYSSSTDTGYKWLDITRTEYYIEEEITDGLNSTIMRTDIPFTTEGIRIIETSIVNVCESMTSDGVLNSYDIYMPSMSDVTTENKENRTLEGIEIVADLPGHIQELVIDLTMQI